MAAAVGSNVMVIAVSGRKPPTRKLFDWCETCAGRVRSADVHSGHTLIGWTTKDHATVMNFMAGGRSL